MIFSRVLITGGAGFVGGNLAVSLRTRHPAVEVIALDNLKRRGSELHVRRLMDRGVRFVHGDVRCAEDLRAIGRFDLLIDCAAEPSVHAGNDGDPSYVLNTNLVGTVNCLELARRNGAAVLLLSTSRVYPIAHLNTLPYREEECRYAWDDLSECVGVSPRGIREDFPLDGPRSLYGTSKLASEQLLQEYVHGFALRALINRCGVIAGPWQMGKVDQGVVALWVRAHVEGQELKYIGFGGLGKQVRDVLHVDDLAELVLLQIGREDIWDGRVYNVGGGPENAISLLELTTLCESVTGRSIPVGYEVSTSPVDVRIFVTDYGKVYRDLGWKPGRAPEQIVRDIDYWYRATFIRGSGSNRPSPD
jgi:CDP-paratose 2-epimerase